MASRNHSGFTLVELLVVVAVIGILVGILVPAVQMAREAARRANCTHNQQEIAKAIVLYEQEKKGYPGYVNRSIPVSAANSPRPLSWLTVLLDYTGRSDLWTSEWRPSYVAAGGPSAVPSAVSPMPMYLCPSDVTHEPQATSYAGNCGHAQDENVYNGVFVYAYSTNARRTKAEDVRDGLSETILLSDNLQAGFWSEPDPLPTLTDAAAVRDATEPYLGILWWTPTETLIPINLGRADAASRIVAPDNPYNYARPSSGHPGGVVMTYCDGHAGFVADDIDYDVFRQMMTPDGRKATPSGSTILY